MCERLRVTKLCVGVTRSCMREMDAAGCHQAPRLPRKTNVDVTKCHTCHANRKLMSPSATGDQARHQIQPVPEVPDLLGKTKVDVAKRHACHAKCHAKCHAVSDQRRPSAPPEPQAKRRWMSPRATPATQSAAASPATSGSPVP